MKRQITAVLCLCLATLGLAAGLFAFPARADNSYGAKTFDDLRALGYSIGASADLPNHPSCYVWVVMFGNGAPWTVLGEPDQSTGSCATDPAVIQQRIDDLIAAYPPLPQTTAAAPAVTPTTTTTPTVDTPAAAPQTTTVTVTVTDPTVQAQIDALNAKIDALTSRVDKLAAANTASWDAFKTAVDGGASSADAALAARSAGLNALLGL